ncbi:hypothetical protein FRB90_010748, partial [Tulasnella sp. 427]
MDTSLLSSPSPSITFLVFPLQTLPPEIFAEIASLLQSTDPHAHITLSHVNNPLRVLVTSTPLLWSRIDFLYPLSLAKLYLERSAGVPLKLAIRIPYPFNYWSGLLSDALAEEAEKLKKFLPAVWPHRHRVQSVHMSAALLSPGAMVDLGDGERHTVHDFLWDGGMNSAEVIDLKLTVWVPASLTPMDSLRELCMRGPWTAEHLLPLMSDRLKSLTLSDNKIPLTTLYQALEAVPNLTSLTLCDLALEGIPRQTPHVLTFNYLDSLSLIRIYTTAVTAFFAFVATPVLKSLVIHLVYDEKDFNHFDLFGTPRPTVLRLDLGESEGTPAFYKVLLRTFPNITHLRLFSCNLLPNRLAVLIAQPTDRTEAGVASVSYPNLKHLTIDNDPNEITATLRLIASSRQSMGCPLESITLRGVHLGPDVNHDLQSINVDVPQVYVAGYDQDDDVYGDEDAGTASETSSIGEWASGDEEIIEAYRKWGATTEAFDLAQANVNVEDE